MTPHFNQARHSEGRGKAGCSFSISPHNSEIGTRPLDVSQAALGCLLSENFLTLLPGADDAAIGGASLAMQVFGCSPVRLNA
jgi:hypothetical protein